MSESSASTGMGPDKPISSSRSGHRSRNIIIMGGLALVLVAGVVLAGVFPTGDRAGTTATDPSSTSSPTATDDPPDDPTTDPSSTPSPTATDDPPDDRTTSASSTSSPSPSPTATVEVKTCREGGDCAVGDTGPGAGLVFYVAESQQSWGRYLEMAPRTWSCATPAEGCGPADKALMWCSDNKHAVATGTAIGTGKANTDAMLTSTSPFVACSSSAPNEVRAYNGGGQSDWSIPSKDELNVMYSYRIPNGKYNSYYFERNNFWSSSQYNYASAYYQLFFNGAQRYTPKSGAVPVRPIRVF